MIDLDIPEDGWLCIWTYGYEASVKMIEGREGAVDYFIEDIGFDKDDIINILAMEENDCWSGDMNGLQIFKMNRGA